MQYVLDQKQGKYILKIWESAPIQGARLLPVLYRLQISFTSESAALQYLEQHLEMNRDVYQERSDL
jgi:hypothetical protein